MDYFLKDTLVRGNLKFFSNVTSSFERLDAGGYKINLRVHMNETMVKTRVRQNFAAILKIIIPSWLCVGLCCSHVNSWWRIQLQRSSIWPITWCMQAHRKCFQLCCNGMGICGSWKEFELPFKVSILFGKQGIEGCNLANAETSAIDHV